jgi:hypothetical protein
MNNEQLTLPVGFADTPPGEGNKELIFGGKVL